MLLWNIGERKHRRTAPYCPASPPHALLSSDSLSASIAINSPFVGLSSGVQTRHPKAVFSVSIRPLFHATSMACRMARSTLEALKAALRASLEYSARPLCRYNAKHFIAVSQ